MKVKDILSIVDEIAPFSLAETWDNSGLQAGHPDWPVQRILVCLDITRETLNSARDHGCDLLLSHHPLMITPEKSLDFSVMPGAAVAMSAIEKIAIISAHTNMDKVLGGLNDYFAQKLGIRCIAPLISEDGEESSHPGSGIGRVGVIEPAVPFRELAARIKQVLGLSDLRIVGDLDQNVSEVALCTGSGGSLTPKFLSSPAQVYVTGDLKYHEARDIEASGKAAADVGHFASEHIVVELFGKELFQRLESHGQALEIIAFNQEKDPFVII